MQGGSFLGIRVLAVVIVAALAFSCVPKLADSPVVENASAAGEDYVKVGMISSVAYWNPLNIQMVEDYIVTYIVYSSLFMYDENWEGPVNDLATGYYHDVHPNGSMTTYINITTSAYFRDFANIDDDSHPLDARDVSYTYNLVKNNSGGTFDWYLEEFSYFTALEQTPGSGVWDQVSTWCSYQKATIIDDISAVPIVPMYLWGPDGENYEQNALGGMDPAEQIGSGPFVFEDWSRDSWYMFKAAPNYHGEEDYGPARTVDIPGVTYSVVSESSAMCFQVNAGDLDCAVLTGDIAAYEGVLGVNPTVNVYKAAVAEIGITDIAVNAIPDSFDAGGGYLSRHPALLDPFVREAIAMTLNRDFIVNKMMNGLPIMAHSVVQPGFWQADLENKVVYDPAGAKALLIANGWADSDGDTWLEATDDAYGVQKGLFPEGTELSNIRCQAIDTDDNYGKIAEAWPGWADDAGIQLIGTIETESTMVNKAWYAADYDIWVWHWGWGPEPIGGALSVWLTSEIEKSGDNCQMPMGPWWYGWDNYTDAPTTWNVDGEIIEYELEGPYSAFDQNISLAWRTLDTNDRKVICDKLQQWVYDSHCELPPYYDLGLYGYTDYAFDNWGDWEAHKGLNVVQGLPWIWFRLEPVVDRKPFFNVEPETWYTAYEGEPEAFAVKVSDEEGSPLWVNFTFGDGEVYNHQLTGDTTVPTWVNVSHTYDTSGILTLNVSLTDGFVDDGVVRNMYREATVEVQGYVNERPAITSVTRNPPSPAYTDDIVTWTAAAYDPDSGDWETGLKFTWDWDDGTYSVGTHDSVANGVEVTDTQTHSWSAQGDYYVVVWVFDETGSEEGEHNVSTTPIKYTILLNQPPENPAVQPIYGHVDSPTECVATSSDADLEDLTFTWEWDDGTFTVDPKTPEFAGQPLTSIVTHEWSAEGLYDITVWVADEAGHNVSTDAVVNITSGNVPPGAISLAWSPDPIYVGVNTTFNVSATDTDGDVISFTVELGDGSTVTNTTEGGTTERQYWEFHHTYDLEGSYMVNITVEDAELSSELTRVVNVILPQENVPPELVILTSYDAFYGEAKTIRPLEAYDPNAEDEITVWFNWGDGTPMSMGDPDDGYAATHTYNATGSFTLNIYADDGEPEHNVSKTATVAVKERNTQATVERIVLEPDKDEYLVDETITFTVTVADLEGDSVTVRIEYGDDEADEKIVDLVAKKDMNVTFEHAYSSSGTMEVTATVDDGFLHASTELPMESVTIEIAKSAFPWALLFGAAICVLVIIAAVAILMKRKKKGGLEDVPSDAGGMEGMAMAPPAEEELPPPS